MHDLTLSSNSSEALDSLQKFFSIGDVDDTPYESMDLDASLEMESLAKQRQLSLVDVEDAKLEYDTSK